MNVLKFLHAIVSSYSTTPKSAWPSAPPVVRRTPANTIASIGFGKISAQPHTTLCIQFLDRENNDKSNTLPFRKQICLTIVWGCAEILPWFLLVLFDKSFFECGATSSLL